MVPILTTLGLLAFLPQQAPNERVVQVSTGWCSPNIANVIGNVTVNCIGVDPRALVKLNVELAQKKLDLAGKIREANDWAKQYKQLESQLSQSSSGDEALSKQAEEYLHAGELDKAGAILDQLLGGEEKQIDRIAADHYSRALVFELQFRPAEALPHLQAAVRYRPENPEYGSGYGHLLLTQGDYAGAEPALKRALASAKQQQKGDPLLHQQYVAKILDDLGAIDRKTERPKEAEASYLRALDMYRALAKQDPAVYSDGVATTLNALALVYSDLERFTESEQALREALALRKELAKQNPAVYMPSVAETTNALAFVVEASHNYIEAEAGYKEALAIRRRLADTNPAAYNGDLADSLNDVGTILIRLKHYTEAEQSLLEAVKLDRSLSAGNPGAFQPSLARSLMNLGSVYMETGRYDPAQAAYSEALQINRKLAEANPKAYGDAVAMSLHNLAGLAASRGDQKAAESSLQEVLKFYRELAKENPDIYDGYIAETLYNLTGVYFYAERFQEAEAACQESLAIYKKLAPKNPQAYDKNVANMLGNLGLIYSSTGRVKEAEPLKLQGVEIYRRLAKQNPAAYQEGLADSLYGLAELRQKLHESKEAEMDCREALSIYRQLTKANPDAYESSLGRAKKMLYSLLEDNGEQADKVIEESSLGAWKRTVSTEMVEDSTAVVFALAGTPEGGQPAKRRSKLEINCADKRKVTLTYTSDARAKLTEEIYGDLAVQFDSEPAKKIHTFAMFVGESTFVLDASLLPAIETHHRMVASFMSAGGSQVKDLFLVDGLTPTGMTSDCGSALDPDHGSSATKPEASASFADASLPH